MIPGDQCMDIIPTEDMDIHHIMVVDLGMVDIAQHLLQVLIQIIMAVNL